MNIEAHQSNEIVKEKTTSQDKGSTPIVCSLVPSADLKECKEHDTEFAIQDSNLIEGQLKLTISARRKSSSLTRQQENPECLSDEDATDDENGDLEFEDCSEATQRASRTAFHQYVREIPYIPKGSRCCEGQKGMLSCCTQYDTCTNKRDDSRSKDKPFTCISPSKHCHEITSSKTSSSVAVNYGSNHCVSKSNKTSVACDHSNHDKLPDSQDSSGKETDFTNSSKTHDNIFEKMSAYNEVEASAGGVEKVPAKRRGRPPKYKQKCVPNPQYDGINAILQPNKEKEVTCHNQFVDMALIVSSSNNNNSDAESVSHIDNMDSVSPDSGIQSIAGSPSGNESPHSLNIPLHLDTTTSSSSDPIGLSAVVTLSSSDGKSSNCSNLKGTMSPGRYKMGLGSSPASSISSVDPIHKHKDFQTDTSGFESEISDHYGISELGVDTNFLITSSPSHSSPSSSPGKKKRRGRIPKKHEFLRKHKSSNLLKTGQLHVPSQSDTTNECEEDVTCSAQSLSVHHTCTSFENSEGVPSPLKKLKLDGEDVVKDRLSILCKANTEHDAINDIVIKHRKLPKKKVGRPSLKTKGNILKRGPGRPPSKGPGPGRPPLKKKRGPGRPPKQLPTVLVKRSPGRPKGSKNKVKKGNMQVTNHAMGHLLHRNASVVNSLHKCMPVSCERTQIVSTMLDSISNAAACSVISSQAGSCSSFIPSKGSVTLLTQKIKRGPGRPRKHPLPQKTVTLLPNLKAYSEKGCPKPDGNEFESLIQSVHDSIKSQFSASNELDESENRSYRDLESIVPTLLTSQTQSHSEKDNLPKQGPKIRRPKLHVMMRRHKKKRGKRKQPVVESSPPVNFPGKYSSLVSKFQLKSAKAALGFAEKSKFTTHSSSESTISSVKQFGDSSSSNPNSYLRKIQLHSKFKRKKLRFYKSKHKNIVDPVFLDDLKFVTENFPNMSISEDGSGTFIRVKPGEVPLPSIFKLHKIDVKQKKKDWCDFDPEKDKHKKHEKFKTKKSQFEFIEKWLAKDKWKGIRKKTMVSESSFDTSLSSEQQCLPPKKRHKMFPSSAEKGDQELLGSDSENEQRIFCLPPVKEKRKVGRPRKRPLPPENVSFEGMKFKDPQAFIQESCKPSREIVLDHDDSLTSVFRSNKSFYSHISSQAKAIPRNCVSKTPVYMCNNQSETVGVKGRLAKDVQMQCENCQKLRKCPLHPKKRGRKPKSATLIKSISRCNLSSSSMCVKKLVEKSVKRNKNLLKRKVGRPRKNPTAEMLSSDTPLTPKVHKVSKTLTESTCGDHLQESSKADIVTCEQVVDMESTPSVISSDTSETSSKSGSVDTIVSTDMKNNEEKVKNMKNKKKRLEVKCLMVKKPEAVENSKKDIDIAAKNGTKKKMSKKEKVSKKGAVIEPKYKKIRNNVHVDAKPVCPDEPHPCNCRNPISNERIGCGENCLNRVMYTECEPSSCPCFDHCSNQKIQRHEWVEGLEKFVTEDRGYGVRAAQDIKAGQFILEYLGEVISEQTFIKRMTENYSQDQHHYCLNLDNGCLIDGYRMGNIGRYVNHSCEPNCEMQKWNVNGLYRMCLFALKDIEPGAELTYDYNFHSFNMETQQICRCGSDECRGVLGGKTQRLNGHNKIQKPLTSKEKRKSKNRLKKLKEKQKLAHESIFPAMKPMSNTERCKVRKHSIFLVRNIDRVRHLRSRLSQTTLEKSSTLNKATFSDKDIFITQLTALKTARSVKTRGLAMAEENSELAHKARLAQVFNAILTSIMSCKDEDGKVIAMHMSLPSRKKYPEYYNVIETPIDFSTVKHKLQNGSYQTVEDFDLDINRIFKNTERYCGKSSWKGEMVQKIRKVYKDSKAETLPLLEDVLGEDCIQKILQGPKTAVVSENPDTQEEDEEEEVIRCVCGVFRDEGLMIQCEKCFVWQHCDCMKVAGDVANYLCELCNPREVSKEILAEPPPDYAKPGWIYYMTLMRDELQIRVGDCVFVLHETPANFNVKIDSVRASYDLISELGKGKLDIFRIERLWKDEKGDRFAFGHNYYHPHETFHEPSRKFFTNEVFRVPLYEIIAFASIVGHCCVMDLNTFCKGKPKGMRDQDIYICEYRLDKTAHFFTKISKHPYPINTKSYCFDKYESRIVPKRTYSPHEVPEAYKRKGDRIEDFGMQDSSDSARKKKAKSKGNSQCKDAAINVAEEKKMLSKIKEEKHQEQRERLNNVLLKLLSAQPSKQKVDASYLLDEKRQRKKLQLPDFEVSSS